MIIERATKCRCSVAVPNLQPRLAVLWRPVSHRRQRLACRDAPEPASSLATYEEDSRIYGSCVSTGDSVVCEIPEGVTTLPPSRQRPTSSDDDVAAPGPSSMGSMILDTTLLVFPFFAWGTSMPALKFVLPHTTPLLLGSLRLLPAGLLLIGWAAANGRKHPQGMEAWLWIALFSLVDGAAFQGFLAEGLMRTSAGLGSVIIDSQPLSVAVLAAVLFGEKLGPAAVGGLLLGVVGLLLVEAPPEVLHGLLTSGDLGASLGSMLSGMQPGLGGLSESGEFWMLLAAQSMALGTVMVRYVIRHADAVYATGYHMVIGGLVLLLAAMQDDPGAMQHTASALTGNDLAILSYVSILGGAASYGLFFYNASVKGNLTALSSLTFLTPVFAVLAGWLTLGETLTPTQLVGAAVTLGSVSLINARPKA